MGVFEFPRAELLPRVLFRAKTGTISTSRSAYRIEAALVSDATETTTAVGDQTGNAPERTTFLRAREFKN